MLSSHIILNLCNIYFFNTIVEFYLHFAWQNIINCHKNNVIKHKILTFLFLIFNFRVENDFDVLDRFIISPNSVKNA